MLGVGLYSMAGVYGQKDHKKIEEMLIWAVENGVKYFDVAPNYGEAETFLGETLKPYREKIKIATKGGISEQGIPDGSRKSLQKRCRESLKRLQTDYIDHYQLHFYDPKTPIEETIEALEKLKTEGLIREYGLGHISREITDEFCKKGHPSTILLEISALETKSYQKFRSLSDDYPVDFVAMGVTGRGLLGGKIKDRNRFSPGDIREWDPLFHPVLESWTIEVYRKLEKIGETFNLNPIQVGLKYVQNLPEVKRVLVGPSKRVHLQEILEGWNKDISREIFEELDEFLKKKGYEKWAILKKATKRWLERAEEKGNGFQNLILALEVLIEEGLLGEKEGHTFLRKGLNALRESDNQRIEEIRNKLGERFLENI